MKTGSPPRPTLRDVARLAGVSHMTVSRVVRGDGNVAAATIARVRDAVEQIGYRPDPALSALAAYRTVGRRAAEGHVLAFLAGESTDYSAEIAASARQEAARWGYGLEVFPLDPGPTAQGRLSRLLYHRGVRGLLFGPAEGPRTFAGWDWREYAAVSLGALSHEPPLHAVAMDYFHSALTCCTALARAGCRRIVFAVEPKLEARTGHRWLGGYLAWTRGAALEPLCLPGAPTRSALRRLRADGLVTIHTEGYRDALNLSVRVLFLNPAGRSVGAPYYSVTPEDIGREGVRMLHHALLRHEYGLPTEPRALNLQGTLRPHDVEGRGEVTPALEFGPFPPSTGCL